VFGFDRFFEVCDTYADDSDEEGNQGHEENQEMAPILSPNAIIDYHTVQVELSDAPTTGEAVPRVAVLMDFALIAETAV